MMGFAYRWKYDNIRPDILKYAQIHQNSPADVDLTKLAFTILLGSIWFCSSTQIQLHMCAQIKVLLAL